MLARIWLSMDGGIGKALRIGALLTALLASTQAWAVATITGFTPTSGPPGTSVTISGQNFGDNTAGTNTISLNGSQINYTSWTTSTIVVTIPNGATSGPFSVFVYSDRSTASSQTSFTVTVPPPTISGFTPASGIVGSSVTINGTNFSATAANNTVKFNGVAATVTAASTTSLTATVPSGATTGPISVTVGGQTATSGSNFTVNLPPPTITGFSPASGPVGTTITITGTNFSTTAASNSICFADVTAPTLYDICVQSSTSTSTSMTVVTPAGGTSGTLHVNAPGGSVVSAATFIYTVPVPTITGFTPTVGPVGTSVTITGTNFDGSTLSNNVVKFNGTAATVTASTSTSITATVPTGATSGAISVTVSSSKPNYGSQTATSSASYTVGYPQPAITGFTPTSGPDGTVVTVSGSNFGASQGVGYVQLNGVTASPTAWSDSSITFAVPAGATTGPITVANNFHTSGTSSGSFTVPAQSAAFVSQSVPSSIAAGATAAVSVTMQNTGSATWTTAQSYSLGSQNPTNNGTCGLARVALPASVSPGQSVTFNFNITAPTTAGTYNFQWQMLQEGVAWFGAATTNVAITVNRYCPGRRLL